MTSPNGAEQNADDGADWKTLPRVGSTRGLWRICLLASRKR